MILAGITSKDFGPFRDEQSIELGEGIYSIICEYDRDVKRSNRGGKTSFVEMVLYVLFGVIRDGLDEVKLIHHGANDMWVEVRVIGDGGEEFTITRGRDAKNNGFLTLSDAEGEKKAEVQALINEKLGITSDDFLLSYYIRQEELGNFFKAKSGERKKVVSRWLEKTYWKEWEEKVKEDIKTIKARLASKQTLLGEMADIEEERIKTEVEVNTLKDRIGVLDKEVQELDNVYKKKEKEYEKRSDLSGLQRDKEVCEENINNLQNSINTSTQLINSLNTEIERYTAAYMENERKVAELAKARQELEEKDNSAADMIQKMNEMMAANNATLNIRRGDLNKTADFKGVCPVTMKDCEYAGSIEEYKAGIQQEIDTLVAKNEYFTKAIAAKQPDVNAYNALKSQVDSLVGATEHSPAPAQYQEVPAKQKQVEENQQSIAESQKAIDKVKNDLAVAINEIDKRKQDTEVAKMLAEVQAMAAEIQEKQSEVGTAKVSLGVAENRIKDLLQKAQDREMLEGQIKNLNSELQDLTFIAYMFSPKGILSVQIENSLMMVEDETNYILQKMGTGIQIEFRSQKEMKTWEPNCLACGEPFAKGTKKHICKACNVPREKKKKDDLHIWVLTHNKRQLYEQDSGGGQTLIAFAFRMAIAKLLQRGLNTRINSVFLDEILGALDEVNVTEVVNVILNSLTTQFAFQQVFMISHKPDVKDSFERIIRIKRFDSEGYSVYENN